ncbi:MAG: hypothetical protein J6B24_04670 [Clostridia bacterium]|nr:hypothetical protein [Clostridia bacterium]
MENNNTKRRPYVRPEADLWLLRLGENIATSGTESDTEEPKRYFDDAFDGEEDGF